MIFSTNQVMGQGIPVLGPGDPAIAIDADGNISISAYPGGEAPRFAIDGDVGGTPPVTMRTKYLNFGGAESGFIVTPVSGLPVQSFQIRAGNDAPARDPATWELYGTNVATLLSQDNSTGMGEAWTLVDSGSIPLNANPALDVRSSLFAPVDVDLTDVGGAGFTHYKMVFPTIRTGDDIMQIGEVQFYDADNAGGNPILASANPILAINERTAPNSSYPGGENPGNAIDQSSASKYLNFGRENSGIIVTNSGGPVTVQALGLTTANDWPGRDPGSYELYGTNDDIISTDNSDGNGGENWIRIAIGNLMLPGDPQVSNDGRFMQVVIPIVHETGAAPYESYKLVFPTVKNNAAPNVNSMQIADIQLYAIPEPASFVLLALMGLALVGTTRLRS
jgi:hypothetical protein